MRSFVMLVLMIAAADAAAPSLHPETQRFVEHLAGLVPPLLEETGVAGVSVGLVTDGEVAWLGAFGLSDRESGRDAEPATVFNVGSISKMVTALGVMRLVERGTLDLDEPVVSYLPRWRGPSRDERITARMLLSHTAGLSLAAVPEYDPGDELPELAEAIAETVERTALPGESYSYSGGGYMLLQLLVEELAGRRFAEFMQAELFEPLGLQSTGYHWSASQVRKAATPYHEGAPTVRFRYAGEAAASLNSSAADLTRLLTATLQGVPPLDRESLTLMRSPAPNSEQQYGLRYGLGFDLWPIGSDDWLAGHNGQNTGWAAAFWSRPATSDGLVVLTNDSDGRALWKWIHCDWVYWLSGITWRGYCTDRPGYLDDPPESRRR